jgi:hypothetical protein
MVRHSAPGKCCACKVKEASRKRRGKRHFFRYVKVSSIQVKPVTIGQEHLPAGFDDRDILE